MSRRSAIPHAVRETHDVGKRKRQKAPDDDDWDRMKPEIERLYTDGKTLKEICQRMTKEHKFEAS